ncbi:PE-PGRS family protein [Streptomyces xiamenensis]
MRLDGAVRGIRAAVFAGVCVVLALFGHVQASGAPVPVSVALVAFSAVALGAWCCAGAGRRPVTVTLAALGVQTGLHLAFSAGQQTTGAAGAAPGSSAVQDLARALLCGDGPWTPLSRDRAHEVITAAGLAVPGDGHGGLGHHAAQAGAHAAHGAGEHHSGGMLLAHLGAALLSGLWLAWGERATCTVLGLLGLWLVAPLWLVRLWSAPVPCLPGPACLPAAEVPVLRARLLLHTMISRGPPRHRAVG